MSDRGTAVFCYCIGMLTAVVGVAIDEQRLQLAGIFWIGCAVFHKLPWRSAGGGE